MTNHPAVQEWLRTASLEAAVNVGDMSDIEASGMAYSYLRDELRGTFPALLEAVKQLTHGCGTVDINWRPLMPQYSSLYVAFSATDEVRLCASVDPATPDVVAAAADALVQSLPQGMPFPKRPYVRQAVFAAPDICLLVRAVDRNAGGNRRERSFGLHTEGGWTDLPDQAAFEGRVLDSLPGQK